MNRDYRRGGERIKSGLLIVGKILVAFGIAVTFMAGSVLIGTHENPNQIAAAWLMTVGSVAVMATTVRFWVTGFFGFIAYGALRSLGAVFVADTAHASRLYIVIVSGSIISMAVLSHRFTSKSFHIRRSDRASIVMAAICLLVTVLLANSYKGVLVFNLGNFALLLAWWAARVARRSHHKTHTGSALTA